MSRLNESLDIMRKLRTDYGIDKNDPGLKELGQRLTPYIKHGKVWAGYIELVSIKRHLHVILPNNPVMPIRVVLKSP